jgi:hypothetical protein
MAWLPDAAVQLLRTGQVRITTIAADRPVLRTRISISGDVLVEVGRDFSGAPDAETIQRHGQAVVAAMLPLRRMKERMLARAALLAGLAALLPPAASVAAAIERGVQDLAAGALVLAGSLAGGVLFAAVRRIALWLLARRIRRRFRAIAQGVA